MPKAPDGYRALLHRGSRGSLWLADDHLLVIENTRFLLCIRETYRRLDFSNIRAILHAPSSRGAWLVVLFTLVILLGFTILGLSGIDSRPAQFFAASLVLPGLIGLIGHLLKGPTQSLTIQTTVRPWRIKPVTRKSHVTQVLAALEPLCHEAQKDIPRQVPDQGSPGDPATHSPPLAFLNTGSPAPTEGTHPLALPAWLCMIAFAAMMAGELIWNALPATLLMMGFAFAALVLLMIACTRGGGTLATGGRGVFIFALSMLGVSLAAGYGAAMTGIMQSTLRGNDSEMGSEMAIIRALAGFPDGSPQGMAIAGMAIAALTGVSGIAGLVATLHRNKLRRSSEQPLTPPPSSPTPP